MKFNRTQLCTILGCLTLALLPIVGRAESSPQQESAGVSKQEKQILVAFDNHVKDYLKQRERIKAKLPQLSKDSKPEQIA
ncbi:MAG TPA: hypothetical protein VFP47_01970, partial [Pyrinomonadaceae bacterium]|nr:hypothetical protein [Pyrinomonadaceae bacterium]